VAGSSTKPSYADQGLTGATAYHYSVSAYDAAGNVSAHSSTVSGTTLSSTGPSVPTGLAGTGVNAYRVALSWTASTDAAGQVSAHSSTVSVTTLDTAAPSVPADVHAKAVSGSQVDLSWTASTDNISVTGYNIYRDGKLAGRPAS